MINTDKYEGHDLSTDEKMNDAIEYIQGSIFHDEDEGRIAEANAQLIADAPLLLAEVKRLREELDGQDAYIKRLSEQLARATKWAYKQVCHNDSAMMDYDDYVWGEEE